MDFFEAFVRTYMNKRKPIVVFGSTSRSIEKEIDTNSIARKPYLRTNYIKIDIEEDIETKKILH